MLITVACVIMFIVVMCYAACVVGGRADDEIERYMNEHPDEFL